MCQILSRWIRTIRALLAWAILATSTAGSSLFPVPSAASDVVADAAASTEAAARPASTTETFGTALVSGALTLPLVRAGQRSAAVVLVHDALGPDPRSDPYVTQLLGAGIAVLEMLGTEEPSEILPLAAGILAGDLRIDGSRIGVLGFGAGGAAAVAAPVPFAARVLLYPGCLALPRGRTDAAGGARTALLLIHGGADPANPTAACASAAEALARHGATVRRIEYAQAGFAWDLPSYGLGGRSLLPAPGGGTERIPAVPWPELAAFSAAQVAGFFARALEAAP